MLNLRDSATLLLVPPIEDLTDEEREGVVQLILRAPVLTDELLLDALALSMLTRLENSRLGGLIIQALHRHMSWEEIADKLSKLIGRKVSQSTIRGWIEPPAKERP